MFLLIGKILGGVGMFLLGVDRLQKGFQESAGHSLRRILSDYTDKVYKGLISGFLVSSAVQSATAITVTLIGFVNSRLLHLKQAIAVVFGANLGKITIVWLITTLGFKLKITSYALPLVGVGAFLKLFLKERQSGIAMALMGFGLIFFGLEILKSSMALINQEIDLQHLALKGQAGVWVYFFAGIVITFVTQSSTSAIAITLAALATGVITIENATALVVGENFGTISGPIIASLKASPNAKRLSMAHIFYNTMASLIGLVLLETLILTRHLSTFYQFFENDIPLGFSFFYSLYVLLALFAVLPLLDPFVKWLQKRFYNRKALGTPRFLEREKAYHPLLAVEAMQKEVQRFGKVSSYMLDQALHWELKRGWVYSPDLTYEERELDRLSEYIHWFASRTARKQSSPEVVKAMQVLSMASRHFENVADNSKKITKLKFKMHEPIADIRAFEKIQEWTESIREILLKMNEILESGALKELNHLQVSFHELESHKIKLRKEIMEAGVQKEMSSSQSIILIDIIDICRQAMNDQIRGIFETWEIKNLFPKDKDKDLRSLSIVS